MIKNKIFYTCFVVILLLGFTFRFYNLNFDNLWFDEIISFNVADPKLTFIETLKKNLELDASTPFYNLTLKYFYKLFGYKTFVGRYLSAILGFLSIIIIFLIISEVSKENNSKLLAIYLSSFNIFLITYSQELRVYSTFFFFCSLSIFFFLRYIKKYNNKNFFIFLTFQLITILYHPFGLIIFFSALTYLIFSKNLLTFYLPKINFFYFLTFFLIFFFIFLYLYFYFELVPKDLFPNFLGDFKFKFITNPFFSNFFGSRILGLIHLLILIFLLIKFKKLFFSKKKFYLFFFLILIFGYSLGLIFNFFFYKILVPRYFIFLILPIILIISDLTYKLKNIFFKNTIILIIILSTLINMITERSFNQFFFKINTYKTDFFSAFDKVNKSETNLLSVALKNPNDKKQQISQIYILNYSKKLSIENSFRIDTFFFNDKRFVSQLEKFWVMCVYEINLNCEIDQSILNTFLIKDIFEFNRLQLIYLNKKKL